MNPKLQKNLIKKINRIRSYNMANRRMFSKTITSSSRFLMMPSSSQNLYFQLGMNADDDGFCEHFTIMRMIEAKPDDLKILHAKGFVQVFDDRVLVIMDWKENNYLRNDRYTPSKYLEIYKNDIKSLSSGIPDGYQMDTQVRLGKVRLGKVSKEKKDNRFAPPSIEEVKNYCLERKNGINAESFIDFYSSKGWLIGKNKMKDWRAAIRTWENRNKPKTDSKIDEKYKNI